MQRMKIGKHYLNVNDELYVALSSIEVTATMISWEINSFKQNQKFVIELKDPKQINTTKLKKWIKTLTLRLEMKLEDDNVIETSLYKHVQQRFDYIKKTRLMYSHQWKKAPRLLQPIEHMLKLMVEKDDKSDIHNLG